MYNPQIETFIKVADAGSFNKAAEELYITPTAVIKQINLLESSLDLVLFERTHRGLILTNAGKSLYQDAKYIIGYCKDSVVRAKNAMSEGENIIRIGSSPTTPAQLLMQMWPKIQEQCPDIKFEIVPFENTPENAKKYLRIWERTLILSAEYLTTQCLNSENARACNYPVSRFAVPYPFTTSLHKRISFKSAIYTVKI